MVLLPSKSFAFALSLVLHVTICGGSFNPEPKIVNGQDVNPPFSFPFAASLADLGNHKCGGTLIAPDVVLTAAHCMESFGEVRLGRHNIRAFAEVHESMVVEKEMVHPQYYSNRFADVDPYDVALVKLYGTSNFQPLQLFSNEDNETTPLVKNTPLSALGWGVRVNTTNATSSILQQGLVYYIPNDDCRNITSTYQGNAINLKFQIIDVTLCAANFQTLTDTCRGDSGGPLIFSTNPQGGVNNSNLRQVGITSAGFGCAHPELPGMYARISHVHDWIRQMICKESEFPPAYLNCQRNAVSSPTDDKDMVPMRLEFQLDLVPQERGWIIQTPNLDAAGNRIDGPLITVAYKPIRSYITQQFAVISESLVLTNNKEYIFTILDGGGNGRSSALGELGLTLTDEASNVDVLKGIGLNIPIFRYSYSLPFVLGTPPSPAPTITPVPTMSGAPTFAPTAFGLFISILLKFDQNPVEIGYILEKELSNGEMEVLHAVYPGTYQNSEYSSLTITETVPLRINPGGTTTQQFRLTMTSNEGRGFLGNGRYEVWEGQVGLGRFLFEGQNFSFEDVNQFGVEPLVIPSTDDSKEDFTSDDSSGGTPNNPTSQPIWPTREPSPSSGDQGVLLDRASFWTICLFHAALMQLLFV